MKIKLAQHLPISEDFDNLSKRSPTHQNLISIRHLHMHDTPHHSLLQAANMNPIRMLFAIGAAYLAPFAAHAQNLYVANQNTNTVAVFNATTGATVPGYASSGLSGPFGLALSGNNLYVSNYTSGMVGEYNATTGAVILGFTAPTGLARPTGLALSGGNLYVASYGQSVVREFNATTGTAVASFTSPTGLIPLLAR